MPFGRHSPLTRGRHRHPSPLASCHHVPSDIFHNVDPWSKPAIFNDIDLKNSFAHRLAVNDSVSYKTTGGNNAGTVSNPSITYRRWSDVPITLGMGFEQWQSSGLARGTRYTAFSILEGSTQWRLIITVTVINYCGAVTLPRSLSTPLETHQTYELKPYNSRDFPRNRRESNPQFYPLPPQVSSPKRNPTHNSIPSNYRSFAHVASPILNPTHLNLPPIIKFLLTVCLQPVRDLTGPVYNSLPLFAYVLISKPKSTIVSFSSIYFYTSRVRNRTRL
ncbi:hypothetical protein PM082_018446 [Marasmius tenuissimus]|nr:hypothetical protein PM082_018446 [Marasmius tenuissimus]